MYAEIKNFNNETYAISTSSEIVNEIGLEAEFFLKNNKGELVYPHDYSLEHDNYPLLGEIRAKPGKNINETLSNFYNALSEVNYVINRDKLIMGFGYEQIDLNTKVKILREMGVKEISDIKNIYKTDILKETDDIYEDGKLIGVNISAGLHIHFSTKVINKFKECYGKFTKSSEEEKPILTQNQIFTIIKNLDKKLFPKFQLPVNLKYRKPGYYELKSYGFEYRSLPMVKEMIEFGTLYDICKIAFDSFSLL